MRAIAGRWSMFDLAVERRDSFADWAIRGLTSTPFLGVALAALTWPIFSILPASGPDPSWVAGLYLAHAEGLQFGKDIVFTYGPLGFLQDPVLYDEALWVVAFLFQVIVHSAVAVALLWSARRAFPLAAAFAACYVLLVIGQLQAAAVLLAFACCFAALGEEGPRFAVPLVTIGGGVLAPVELLAKANYGIAIFGIVALTVLGLPDRRRNLPLFLVTAGGTFAVCWAAAGQDFSNLPAFASRTGQIVSGYSAAMVTDIVVQQWERVAAPLAIALLLAGAALASRRDPAPRRIASIGLVALFSFMAFKQGFVRQGLGNTPEFFVLVAGAGIVVASRLPRLPLRAAALGLVLPLAALALAVLPTASIWQSLKPQHHVEFLRRDLDALLRPAERRTLIAEARTSLRAGYRLDPAVLDAVGHRAVHIDPWEISLAWAYGLRWHPLPVIQSYSAYTPELDRLNAASLTGPDAPTMVLRHSGLAEGARGESVDNRYPGWESPAAMRAMLCNYRAVRTTPRWQLLERAGDRCGAPRPIGVAHAVTGETISTPAPPAPREIVFARIGGIGVEGWEAAESVLYRARERTATLGERGTWSLVPATAGDGLVLHAAPRVDYPAPFRLVPDSPTVSFDVDGAAPRPLTVRFFAQHVGEFPPRRTVGARLAPAAAQSGRGESR